MSKVLMLSIGDVAADPKVAKLLEENGIKAKSKDSIGVRVGIVNQESAAEIADYRKHLASVYAARALTAAAGKA